MKMLVFECAEPKGPHPAFGHLLPFFEREKANTSWKKVRKPHA